MITLITVVHDYSSGENKPINLEQKWRSLKFKTPLQTVIILQSSSLQDKHLAMVKCAHHWFQTHHTAWEQGFVDSP